MDAWEDMAYKHFTLNMMALLPVWFGIVRSQNPDTFWSDYPACEEKCHQSVWADQQCSLQNSCGCTSGQTSGCLCLADKCLCVTNSWLITVSQCIGQQCGSAAVTNAASIVQNACSGKGYNLAVPSSELVSAGLAAITTTVAPSTSSYICEFNIPGKSKVAYPLTSGLQPPLHPLLLPQSLLLQPLHRRRRIRPITRAVLAYLKPQTRIRDYLVVQ